MARSKSCVAYQVVIFFQESGGFQGGLAVNSLFVFAQPRTEVTARKIVRGKKHEANKVGNAEHDERGRELPPVEEDPDGVGDQGAGVSDDGQDYPTYGLLMNSVA